MTTEIAGLWETVESYLAAENVELDDIEILGAGPRIVRVSVDAQDGVGVDHLARLSRALSRMLDDLDPFDGAYTLEVSSPGLERKLRRPRHYEKALGRDVKIKTTAPVEGKTSHRGVLVSSDDEGCTVEVDGEGRRIEFDHVQSARTVFEWKKAPKPGQKSG